MCPNFYLLIIGLLFKTFFNVNHIDRTGDEIKHMKVVQITDGSFSGRRAFCLSETYSFRSLVDLINHHAHNSLRESFKG